MPQIKRHVDPVNLGKVKIPKECANELEALTNTVIAGSLAQLSSVSFFAQDIFQELGEEAKIMGRRIEKLQRRTEFVDKRVDKLSQNLPDPGCSLQHGQLGYSPSKRPCSINYSSKSSNSYGHVLDRSTMPTILKDYYNNNCSAPPPLSNLDNCREPHDPIQESLKIYTDPDFFFHLWREEIQAQNRQDLQRRKQDKTREARRNARKQGVHKSNIDKPLTHKDKWREQAMGREFNNNSYSSSQLNFNTMQTPSRQSSNSSIQYRNVNNNKNNRPVSLNTSTDTGYSAKSDSSRGGYSGGQRVVRSGGKEQFKGEYKRDINPNVQNLQDESSLLSTVLNAGNISYYYGKNNQDPAATHLRQQKILSSNSQKSKTQSNTTQPSSSISNSLYSMEYSSLSSNQNTINYLNSSESNYTQASSNFSLDSNKPTSSGSANRIVPGINHNSQHSNLDPIPEVNSNVDGTSLASIGGGTPKIVACKINEIRLPINHIGLNNGQIGKDEFNDNDSLDGDIVGNVHRIGSMAQMPPPPPIPTIDDFGTGSPLPTPPIIDGFNSFSEIEKSPNDFNTLKRSKDNKPEAHTLPISNSNTSFNIDNTSTDTVSEIPAPPPLPDFCQNISGIDDYPIENRFADLTLTRPKKKNQKNSKQKVNQVSKWASLAGREQNAQNIETKSIASSTQSATENSSIQSDSNNLRSNLLMEIRKGRELRKVQQQEQREKMMNNAVSDTPMTFIDVANVLLSRRMFLKDDSDEDDSNSFRTGSDDEWDD